MLLHTPLTPFLGVLYNIIAEPNAAHEDVQLLHDFVATLRPVCRLSEGIQKFHTLCSLFVNIARAYVRVKSQQLATNDAMECSTIPSPELQPVISEFDEHFSALGFFGPSGLTQQEQFSTQSGDWQDNSLHTLDMTGLQDGYLGNISLYGLLEQDLNELGPQGLGYFDGDSNVR